jgi:diadenosine tetraphosphate (Ap4A) HIT family hydrolase
VIKIAENTRFHWLLTGGPSRAGEIWNTELLGSKSFAVVPSLGALVPGWVLIVPRRPMLSLRELSTSEQAELFLLIQRSSAALRVFGGRVSWQLTSR